MQCLRGERGGKCLGGDGGGAGGGGGEGARCPEESMQSGLGVPVQS